MTKFMQLPSNKEIKKTVFTKVLDNKLNTTNSFYPPESYNNIIYLGKSEFYGDIFKAWNDSPEDFLVYFGVKGDEDYITI